MTDEAIAVAIQRHDQEIGSIKHRVDALEESRKSLSELVTMVNVIATKQGTIEKNVSALTSKVDDIAGRSGKRWESVVDKALMVLVSGIMLYLLSKMGL